MKTMKSNNWSVNFKSTANKSARVNSITLPRLNT